MFIFVNGHLSNDKSWINRSEIRLVLESDGGLSNSFFKCISLSLDSLSKRTGWNPDFVSEFEIASSNAAFTVNSSSNF